MRSKRIEIGIGCGLVLFGLIAAWRTLGVPQVAAGTVAGPAFVPWLMIGAMVVLSLALIARSYFATSSMPVELGTTPEDVAEPVSKSAKLRIFAFTVMLIAYAALFMTVGYLVSTLFVFFVGLLIIGERNPVMLVMGPVLIGGAIYFGFTELLGVWLP